MVVEGLLEYLEFKYPSIHFDHGSFNHDMNSYIICDNSERDKAISLEFGDYKSIMVRFIVKMSDPELLNKIDKILKENLL